MNNHEHQTKQTYESYTFQPLMSFCINLLFYIDKPKKRVARNFNKKKYNPIYMYMSYSNGLLNFKNKNKQVILKGAPGVGFNLTSDGNYDMANKKLTNVKEGNNKNDVITCTGQLPNFVLKVSENSQSLPCTTLCSKVK